MVTSCSSTNWGRDIEVVPAALEPDIEKRSAPPGLTTDHHETAAVPDRDDEILEAKRVHDLNVH